MGMEQGNLQTNRTAFLDHLANDLKVGRDSAYRRAVRRALEIVKKNYESGQYQSTTEAEYVFRKMVEQENEASQH